jgi:hypothetical protein
MVIIRKEQMNVFARPVAADLACRIRTHVTRTFPAQCDALGEAEVRRRVRAGIARARGYGLQSHYDILRFVDLLFVLGPDFDSDPDLPWAKEILTDPSARDGSERLDRLYEKTRRQRGETGGRAEA